MRPSMHRATSGGQGASDQLRDLLGMGAFEG